ncbi:MAG: InlB B-repeat-containing protein, partial [Clostridia bacterium]|nr:InlB B-repeat-containing protein [Clostridia bacterium]
TEGYSIVLLSPTKTGYNFDGWYSDPSFNTKVSVIVNKDATEDVNLYAKWSLYNYFIKYYLGGGTNDELNATSYNIESDRIILKAPTKTGYEFKGWFKDSEFAEQISVIETGSYGNLRLYAKWQVITFNITYHLNGGTNNANNPSSYTIEMQPITLNEPTKQHYDFAGWYLDSALTAKVVVIDVTSNKNINLYAKWTPCNYSIIYNTNGGTNNLQNPNSYTVEDQDITLLSPTKNGYDFAGWYEESSFVNKIQVIDTSKGKEINVYAKWTLVNYSITYKLLGGTNDVNNLKSYTIETATFQLQPATKFGYEFKGWYTDNEYKTQITEIKIGSYGNIEVYAKYKLIEYNITYHLNGGENSINNPKKYSVETTDFTLEAGARIGAKFEGWYSDSQLTKKVESLDITQYCDIDLYAKWSYINYAINYVLDDGANNLQNPQTYTILDTITLLPATKKYYDFAGWYTDSKFNNQLTEITLGSYGELTLYAKWTPTVYNIKYNLNGGTNNQDNPVTFTYFSDEITLLEPSRDGYVFVNWYSNESFEDLKLTIPTNTEGDVEVFAKWEAIFTISGSKITGLTEFAKQKTDLYTVTVPAQIDGNKIYTLGDYVFNSTQNVRKVIICEGITTVYSAFKNSNNILSISIPSTVTTFNSINSCYGLVEIINKSSCTITHKDSSGNTLSIHNTIQSEEYSNLIRQGNFMFYKNSDNYYLCDYLGTEKSIILPDDVNSSTYKIKQYAFYDYQGLEEIKFSSGVTKIENYAFNNCSSLKSITLSSSVAAIGDSGNTYSANKGTFFGCSNLKSIYYEGSMEQWFAINIAGKDSAPLCNGTDLYINDSKVVNLIVPDSVSSISAYLFAGCQSITSFSIGKNSKLTTIDPNAFYDCSLKALYFQGTVEDWINYNKKYLNPLTKFTLDLYINNELVVDLVIPSSVTSIELSTFRNIYSLNTVTFEQNAKITSIGESAFRKCTNLQTVTFGQGCKLTNIGYAAFAYCESLESITIPALVANVDDYAFEDCTKLKT